MSLSQPDIQTMLDQFKAEDQLLIANYNQEAKYLLDNCYRESITFAVLAGKKCGASLYSEMDRTQEVGTSDFHTKVHDETAIIGASHSFEGENATILDAGHKDIQTTHNISKEGIAVNVDQVAFPNKNKPQRKLSHSFSSEDLAILAKNKRQRKISHSYSSEEILLIRENEKVIDGDVYDKHLNNEGKRIGIMVSNKDATKTDNYGDDISMAGVRKGIMRRYFHNSKTDLSNHAINHRDTRNEQHSIVEFSRSALNKNIKETSERDTQNKEDIPVKLSTSTHDKKSDLINQVASHTNTQSIEDFDSSSFISPSTSRRTSNLENPSGREADKVGVRRRKVSFFCGQPLTGIDSLFTAQENIEKDQAKEAHQNEESRTHEEELRKNKFRTNHWPGRKMSRSSFVYHL